MTTTGPRGVLFDLDDTLLDHHGASSRAVLAFAAARGPGRPEAELLATWHRLTEVHYARYQARELSHAEHRRVRIRAFLQEPWLSDDDADAAFADYQRRYQAGWRAHDDAAPALRRCRAAGLAVGVLTNGEADIQTSKLRATGLLELVDAVAASSGLSAAKPDPRAFTEASARLGLRPEEVVMVGDSPTHDVRGALDAGLDAVWLDRHGAGAPPDLADLAEVTVVRSLDEVVPG